MKKALHFMGVVALLAAALLSSACGPIILSTPAAVPVFTPLPTSAAAATATPSHSPGQLPSASPSLTLTPTPSPAVTGQGGWHLLTAPPLLSGRDTPAPQTDGYHVVHMNGRQGIVDDKGKTVLKADFSSICVITGGSKTLFFAVPYGAGSKTATRKSSGFLYDAAGKLVSRERFSDAYAVGDSLVAVCGEAKADPVYGEEAADDETGGESNEPVGIAADVGAVDFNGRQVIPRKYYMICRFADTVAALRQGGEKGAYAVDFYGLDGALKGTMPAGGAYDSGEGLLEGMQPEANLLVLRSSNNLFGVLDSWLRWAVPPQYDEIGYNGTTGQFVVRRGSLYGVLGSDGAVVVPVAYQAESMDGNVDGPFYSFSTAGATQMFDSSGREVFRSTEYESVTWCDGVLVASKSGKSCAIDAAGRNLLPGVDCVQDYHAEEQLFECRDAAGNVGFYDESGAKLPLPASKDIDCIASGRFIINTNAGSGLCDGRGKWLMKPQYAYIEPLGGGLLLYAERCAYNAYFDTNIVYGLASMDGRVLTKPVYYAFEASGSLYFAETADAFGMLNSKLKWAWSAGQGSLKD